MSGDGPTPLELQIIQLVALWRQGPATRHDPVLVSMSARLTAAISCSAPPRVLEALKDMQTRGLSVFARADRI